MLLGVSSSFSSFLSLSVFNINMLVLPFSPSTSHKFYPCQTNFYIWNILKVLTYDLQITWLFKMEFKTLKSKCIFHPDYPRNLDIYMEASVWRKCISDKSEGLSNNNNKQPNFWLFNLKELGPPNSTSFSSMIQASQLSLHSFVALLTHTQWGQ